MLGYLQRLAFLGLESLRFSRVKYDLIMCYKILNGQVTCCIAIFLSCQFSLVQEATKQQSNVNAYKYFFCNRACDIWNALPDSVVEASSSDSFKRLLDQVDLTQFTALCCTFHGHMSVATCPLCPVYMCCVH